MPISKTEVIDPLSLFLNQVVKYYKCKKQVMIWFLEQYIVQHSGVWELYLIGLQLQCGMQCWYQISWLAMEFIFIVFSFPLHYKFKMTGYFLYILRTVYTIWIYQLIEILKNFNLQKQLNSLNSFI